MSKPIEINLTVDGPNSDKSGTKSDPFTSGSFRLHIRPTGEAGKTIQYTYKHKWISGGTPVHPDGVEMWYGREGKNPTFTAAPKKVLSQLQLTAICWYGLDSDKDKPGSQTVRESEAVWVMSFEQEPTPTWWIYCTDGRVIVVSHEMTWLREKHYAYVNPWDYAKIRFRNASGQDGTVAELESMISSIPSPGPAPDPEPTPDPEPEPDPDPDPIPTPEPDPTPVDRVLVTCQPPNVAQASYYMLRYALEHWIVADPKKRFKSYLGRWYFAGTVETLKRLEILAPKPGDPTEPLPFTVGETVVVKAIPFTVKKVEGENLLLEANR
jgi:hypothetical protein